MASKTLKIIPLGGLGEIGKNMLALEYGENILIVDCGIMFPENDMLGIDYIIPDFSYLEDKWQLVRGLVLTHGHEDHIGAVRHVLEEENIPMYATKLTRGLLEVKLKRAGLLEKADLTTVKAGEGVSIGPFNVEFFHVSHSIPDAVGLAIDTPIGLLVHTGDYKFDHTPVDGWPTDFSKLGEIGGRDVLALLADSTNADTPGWTPSEANIDEAFDRVIEQAEGRVLIASFASNVSRMQQALNAAQRHGRKMAFVGTSMVDNAKMARSLGYLEAEAKQIVSIEEALSMKPSKVVLMVTGTQGEPYSILGRLSTDSQRQFNVEPGDTIVLSSHIIPGNEEMVHRTINRLFRRGAHVIYEPIMPVHVSGHASQEEMKLMLHLVKPRYFIPVHGELRHLNQHADMAVEIGIPRENIAVIENGTQIEFKKGGMKIGDRHPGRHIFVDGSLVGDVGPKVMREREYLAKDGFVAIHLQLDEKSGKMTSEPEFVSRGFMFDEESDELFEHAQTRIQEQLAKSNGNDIETLLEKQLAKLFFEETRRRPLVVVFIS